MIKVSLHRSEFPPSEGIPIEVPGEFEKPSDALHAAIEHLRSVVHKPQLTWTFGGSMHVFEPINVPPTGLIRFNIRVDPMTFLGSADIWCTDKEALDAAAPCIGECIERLANWLRLTHSAELRASDVLLTMALPEIIRITPSSSLVRFSGTHPKHTANVRLTYGTSILEHAAAAIPLVYSSIRELRAQFIARGTSRGFLHPEEERRLRAIRKVRGKIARYRIQVRNLDLMEPRDPLDAIGKVLRASIKIHCKDSTVMGVLVGAVKRFCIEFGVFIDLDCDDAICA